MNIKDLKYPVILIKDNEPVPVFARNIDELSTCSYSAFQKKYYSGIEVIDCQGNTLQILEALPLRPLGLFGFLKRAIKIELISTNVINSKNQITTLESFKKKLINLISNQNYLYDSETNISELIIFIENQATIEKIINKLTEDFFRTY